MKFNISCPIFENQKTPIVPQSINTNTTLFISADGFTNLKTTTSIFSLTLSEEAFTVVPLEHLYEIGWFSETTLQSHENIDINIINKKDDKFSPGFSVSHPISNKEHLDLYVYRKQVSDPHIYISFQPDAEESTHCDDNDEASIEQANASLEPDSFEDEPDSLDVNGEVTQSMDLDEKSSSLSLEDTTQDSEAMEDIQEENNENDVDHGQSETIPASLEDNEVTMSFEEAFSRYLPTRAIMHRVKRIPKVPLSYTLMNKALGSDGYELLFDEDEISKATKKLLTPVTFDELGVLERYPWIEALTTEESRTRVMKHMMKYLRYLSFNQNYFANLADYLDYNFYFNEEEGKRLKPTDDHKKKSLGARQLEHWKYNYIRRAHFSVQCSHSKSGEDAPFPPSTSCQENFENQIVCPHAVKGSFTGQHSNCPYRHSISFTGPNRNLYVDEAPNWEKDRMFPTYNLGLCAKATRNIAKGEIVCFAFGALEDQATIEYRVSTVPKVNAPYFASDILFKSIRLPTYINGHDRTDLMPYTQCYISRYSQNTNLPLSPFGLVRIGPNANLCPTPFYIPYAAPCECKGREQEDFRRMVPVIGYLAKADIAKDQILYRPLDSIFDLNPAAYLCANPICFHDETTGVEFCDTMDQVFCSIKALEDGIAKMDPKGTWIKSCFTTPTITDANVSRPFNFPLLRNLKPMSEETAQLDLKRKREPASAKRSRKRTKR